MGKSNGYTTTARAVKRKSVSPEKEGLFRNRIMNGLAQARYHIERAQECGVDLSVDRFHGRFAEAFAALLAYVNEEKAWEERFDAQEAAEEAEDTAEDQFAAA